MPGQATDISVGADGTVWKVGTTVADDSGDYRLAKLTPNVTDVVPVLAVAAPCSQE